MLPICYLSDLFRLMSGFYSIPAIQLSHEEFSNAPHNEAGLGWVLYQTPQGKAIGKGRNSVHMSCRAWAVPEKRSE
jgi:hypothetical protein